MEEWCQQPQPVVEEDEEVLEVDYHHVPVAGECEHPSGRKRVFACDSFEHESTSVVKGGRSSPRIVDANEESPLGVRFSSILHPRSEGKDRRKWSVCV